MSLVPNASHQVLFQSDQVGEEISFDEFQDRVKRYIEIEKSNAYMKFGRNQVTNEYKRIHHECESRGSRLASRGQTVIARDRFFYPVLTRIMDHFSCSPLNTAFSY